MGRNRHKWSGYFKILDELANKSNKAAICYACLEALGGEAKKITNKANLCYNHLKSCPNFAKKYTTEELEKILQIDNESNYESSEEDTVKKIKQTESQNVAKPVKRKSQTSVSQYLCRPLADDIQQQFERHLICGTVVNGLPFKWIQDDNIVAAFKLVNPAIQLPSRHKLSRSILKKEVNITKEQFELLAKDDNIGVTLVYDGWKNVVKQKIMGTILITSKGKALVWNAEDVSSERSCASNINSYTERYIEDLAIKNISVIGIVSDSAGENVKSRKELRTQYTNIVFLPCFAHQANLCVGDIFKSSERYREVSNQAIKITSFFNMSTYFLGQLRSQQMNLYNGKAYALTSPCATRWNSFYNSFHSILKSKGALTILATNMENSANPDDKKFPSDIANIINDSIFWNNLKELDEILLPFCATLNKL